MYMRSLVTLLFICLSLTSSAAPATPAVEKDKPTYVINGVIARNNILDIGDQMLKDVDAGATAGQLIINSPGGSVVTGFRFITRMDAARAKGMRITCFVTEMAASMAFQILLHCDERHTLNTSFLLWHRARVQLGGLFGEPMTGPQAEVLSKDLLALDTNIYRELQATLGKHIPEQDLRYHFEVETLHTGANLHAMAPKFITTHAYVPGLLEALEEAVNGRKESEESLDMDPSEFIYITRKIPIQGRK
jgi:ATP-dependent protease ClpP protease subunit